MFFLPQSAGRSPPIEVFLSGVFGKRRGHIFSKNEHFSKPPKGGDIIAVFRIVETHDYKVLSNYHLRNTKLSLKSKGLLSMMLSLPQYWNYTTRSLAKVCRRHGQHGFALKELERTGYITHN